MRAIRYSLLVLAVIAAFAISIVLLTREFAADSSRAERRASLPAGTTARNETEPKERPTTNGERTSGAPTQPTERPASTGPETDERKTADTQPSQSAPNPRTPPAQAPAGVPADVVERAFADAPPATPNRRPGSAFDPLALPPAGAIAPQARAPETRAQEPRTQETRTQETRIPEPPSRQQQQRAVPTGPLSLSGEQQEKIRNLLLTHSIMQSPASEFPLQVGALVPPEVELMPLPHEIADAIPNYRGYSYVIAQNRIVIVATEKRAISLLIPM